MMPATAIPLRASATSIRVLGKLRVLYMIFTYLALQRYIYLLKTTNFWDKQHGFVINGGIIGGNVTNVLVF